MDRLRRWLVRVFVNAQVEPHPIHQAVIVRSDGSFDERLALVWDALLRESRTNTVFLTSGWLRAWQETLGQSIQVTIAQINFGERLVAAAAFQIVNGVVEFAGSGPSDYSDFLVSKTIDNETHLQLIQRLLVEARRASRGFRYFKLGRIQPDSLTLHAFDRPGTQFFSTTMGQIDAPYLAMTDVESRLRKKSLRRHDKTLQKSGAVVSETFTRASDILPQLDAFFDQHVARWRYSGERSLFLRGSSRRFYRAVTSRLDNTGELRFTTVRVDGALVAAHFGFLRAGRYIWYKPAFDPALAKLSPGEVLIKVLFERARDEGATELDFTVGSEPFKYRFASDVRKVTYLYVTDSRIAALARRGRVFAVHGLRALVARARAIRAPASQPPNGH